MGSMESLSQGITTIQSLSTGPVNTSSTHIFTYSIISGLSRFSVDWLANIFGYLANLRKLLACCLWNIMWTDKTGHTSLSEGWLCYQEQTVTFILWKSNLVPPCFHTMCLFLSILNEASWQGEHQQQSTSFPEELCLRSQQSVNLSYKKMLTLFSLN